MMREFKHMARPWLAFLVVPVFLSACGDGDDPSTPRFTEEIAEQLADAAEDVVGPITATGEVRANLGNAVVAVLEMEGTFGSIAMLPFRAAERMVAQPVAAERMKAPMRTLLMAAVADPQDILLPDQALGLTFVWDENIQGYVPDSTITGAPANGARFIYYELAFSGLPAQPLNPLGYVQLVDASTFDNARLEVDMVRDAGNITLIDYYVEGSVTMSTQSATYIIDAAGFISDGSQQVDFELHWDATATETTFDETADFAIVNEGTDGALRLDYEAVSDQSSETMTGVFVVEHGDDAAVFDFEREVNFSTFDGTVEGALTFNGAEVVVFSGDAFEPSYTRPDGGELGEIETDALLRMWDMFMFTQGFAFEIMIPFLYLLIF